MTSPTGKVVRTDSLIWFVRLKRSVIPDNVDTILPEGTIGEIVDVLSTLVKLRIGGTDYWMNDADLEVLTPFEVAVHRRLKEAGGGHG